MPYESVTFNGQPLTFDEGWWMDRSFLRANLNGRVRVGVNELVVQLSYAQSQHVYDVLYGGGNEALRNCLSFDMEIESAYLFGDFAVEMPGNHRADVMRTDVYTGPFYVVAAKDTVNVRNVVKDGYPFFAGTMHYAFDLDWKTGDTTRLDLSDGRFSTCAVKVNGVDAGRMFFETELDLAPYLKEGKNRVEFAITTSCRNLMGPHHTANPEPTGVGPTTFSCESSWVDERCDNYRPERYSFVLFGLGE
jgi:hypothetical protein